MTDRVRQVAGTLTTRIICLTVGMAASIVIARSLQAEGRGTYYVAVTIASTAIALGHLSIEQAQTTLWPTPTARPALTANSIPLGVLLGTLASLLTLATLTLLGPRTLHLPSWEMTTLALAGVPSAIASLYAGNIATLRGKVHVANQATLLGSLAQCAALAALALTDRLTPLSVIAVWTFTGAMPLLILRRACCHTAGTGRPLATRLARTAITTGVRYHLGPVCTYLLLRLDILLLNAWRGPREVGVYSLAVVLADLSRLATDAISQVALPRQFGGTVEESIAVTLRVTRYGAAVATACVLALVAAAPLAVTPLYGGSFAGAVPLIVLLAPGMLALAASRPPSAFLLREGAARYVVLPSVVALVLNTALNVVLIPTMGAAGCAVASSLAYLTLAALQVTFFTRVTRTRRAHLLPTRADVADLVTSIRSLLPAPSR